jgi:hypothetical protein
MLASPEVRQAIKDSRGKCRSRWRDITQEIIRPYRGHFPASPRIGTRLVHGENADADRLCPLTLTVHGRDHWRGLNMDNLRMRQRSWLRIIHGHGLCRTWSERNHGEAADADAVADWTWPRRGFGLATATDRARTDRGCGHRRGHLPATLRFHRDCFADSKTSVCRGVTRASSKTGRLNPCECQSTADQV